MVRLNLQLFAKLNTDTSIVDYLKSQGKDSSYSARAKLAKELGIENYSGTASQNTQMLKTLKNNASSSSGKTNSGKTNTSKTNTSKTNTNKTNTSTSNVTSIKGADQSLVDKANSSFAQSGTVTNAQKEASDALGKVKELGSVTDIVDQSTWDAINTPFTSSSAYQEAMAYTNQLLEQLSSGRTSYTDQIKELMGQIQNREDFQYDMATDTLFQQSLTSAMASGQTAMRDTIGQASALTGGYASTYATSAGNQAYNAYIQDAYNNLPEYYNMALEAYQMEGQEMYNQLAMLNDADATEFQRMYDSWNANFTNAQNMYSQEYSAWQDSVNNAYNSANLQLQEHGQLYDQAYNTYTAVQNNANNLYAQEFQKWQNEVSNAMQYMGMQNTDYWNTQNFNEEQRQFDESLAWDKDSFAQQLAEQQRQFNSEMAYKNSALAQDQAQFVSRYDVNGDGKVDSKDLTYDSGGGSGGGSGDFKSPTETQMKKALDAYNSGGEDAYLQYIDSLPSNVDVEAIDLYVNGDGKSNKGYGQLPLAKRTFTVVDDGGVNWFWGVDNNAKVKDQYGNTYTLEELAKTDKNLALELTKLAKGKSYTAK